MGIDISLIRLLKQKPANSKYKFNKIILEVDGETKSHNLPSWTNEYISDYTDSRIDYDAFMNMHGFDLMKCSLNCVETDDNGKVVSWLMTDNDTRVNHTIPVDDIPKKQSNMKVIWFEEIGYQRKGLNNKFYRDAYEGIPDDEIFDKQSAIEFMNKYCDDSHKDHFQREIIDKFVDRECILYIL